MGKFGVRGPIGLIGMTGVTPPPIGLIGKGLVTTGPPRIGFTGSLLPTLIGTIPPLPRPRLGVLIGLNLGEFPWGTLTCGPPPPAFNPPAEKCFPPAARQ